MGALYAAFQTPALEGLRPATPKQELHTGAGSQDITARLWQDPLEAVADNIAGNPKSAFNKRHSPDQFHQSLADRRTNGEQLTVLAVSVPGDSYVEDAEARRRLRYAVTAALNVQEYEPEDETHIGYLDLGLTGTGGPEIAVTETPTTRLIMRDVNNARASDVSDNADDRIPFEWFRGRKDQRSAVVLWVNETSLISEHQPLARLDHIASSLGLRDPSIGDLQFALIGPVASTTLRQMVTEAACAKPSLNAHPLAGCESEKSLENLRGLQIYNTGATISDEELYHDVYGIDLPNPNVCADTYAPTHRLPVGALEFQSNGLEYIRTTNTDEDLACTLFDELRRRLNGQNIPWSQDSVSLVSEWDTAYGQRLPDTVARVFDQRIGILEKSSVYKYSYLRGLDGQVPGAAERASSSAHNPMTATADQSKTRNAAAPDTESRDWAIGESQFDYLRRLTDHMRTPEELALRLGKRNVVAIGVLGSDVFDKLTILQALRPEFPEAIFFTTDLDALLLRKENAATPET
jgi:hypothetical protein